MGTFAREEPGDEYLKAYKGKIMKMVDAEMGTTKEGNGDIAMAEADPPSAGPGGKGGSKGGVKRAHSGSKLVDSKKKPKGAAAEKKAALAAEKANQKNLVFLNVDEFYKPCNLTTKDESGNAVYLQPWRVWPPLNIQASRTKGATLPEGVLPNTFRVTERVYNPDGDNEDFYNDPVWDPPQEATWKALCNDIRDAMVEAYYAIHFKNEIEFNPASRDGTKDAWEGYCLAFSRSVIPDFEPHLQVQESGSPIFVQPRRSSPTWSTVESFQGYERLEWSEAAITPFEECTFEIAKKRYDKALKYKDINAIVVAPLVDEDIQKKIANAIARPPSDEVKPDGSDIAPFWQTWVYDATLQACIPRKKQGSEEAKVLAARENAGTYIQDLEDEGALFQAYAALIDAFMLAYFPSQTAWQEWTLGAQDPLGYRELREEAKRVVPAFHPRFGFTKSYESKAPCSPPGTGTGKDKIDEALAKKLEAAYRKHEADQGESPSPFFLSLDTLKTRQQFYSNRKRQEKIGVDYLWSTQEDLDSMETEAEDKKPVATPKKAKVTELILPERDTGDDLPKHLKVWVELENAWKAQEKLVLDSKPKKKKQQGDDTGDATGDAAGDAAGDATGDATGDDAGAGTTSLDKARKNRGKAIARLYDSYVREYRIWEADVQGRKKKGTRDEMRAKHNRFMEATNPDFRKLILKYRLQHNLTLAIGSQAEERRMVYYQEHIERCTDGTEKDDEIKRIVDMEKSRKSRKAKFDEEAFTRELQLPSDHPDRTTIPRINYVSQKKEKVGGFVYFALDFAYQMEVDKRNRDKLGDGPGGVYPSIVEKIGSESAFTTREDKNGRIPLYQYVYSLRSDIDEWARYYTVYMSPDKSLRKEILEKYLAALKNPKTRSQIQTRNKQRLADIKLQTDAALQPRFASEFDTYLKSVLKVAKLSEEALQLSKFKDRKEDMRKILKDQNASLEQKETEFKKVKDETYADIRKSIPDVISSINGQLKDIPDNDDLESLEKQRFDLIKEVLRGGIVGRLDNIKNLEDAYAYYTTHKDRLKERKAQIAEEHADRGRELMLEVINNKEPRCNLDEDERARFSMQLRSRAQVDHIKAEIEELNDRREALGEEDDNARLQIDQRIIALNKTKTRLELVDNFGSHVAIATTQLIKAMYSVNRICERIRGYQRMAGVGNEADPLDLKVPELEAIVKAQKEKREKGEDIPGKALIPDLENLFAAGLMTSPLSDDSKQGKPFYEYVLGDELSSRFRKMQQERIEKEERATEARFAQKKDDQKENAADRKREARDDALERLIENSRVAFGNDLMKATGLQVQDMDAIMPFAGKVTADAMGGGFPDADKLEKMSLEEQAKYYNLDILDLELTLKQGGGKEIFQQQVRNLQKAIADVMELDFKMDDKDFNDAEKRDAWYAEERAKYDLSLVRLGNGSLGGAAKKASLMGFYRFLQKDNVRKKKLSNASRKAADVTDGLNWAAENVEERYAAAYPQLRRWTVRNDNNEVLYFKSENDYDGSPKREGEYEEAKPRVTQALVIPKQYLPPIESFQKKHRDFFSAPGNYDGDNILVVPIPRVTWEGESKQDPWREKMEAWEYFYDFATTLTTTLYVEEFTTRSNRGKEAVEGYVNAGILLAYSAKNRLITDTSLIKQDCKLKFWPPDEDAEVDEIARFRQAVEFVMENVLNLEKERQKRRERSSAKRLEEMRVEAMEEDIDSYSDDGGGEDVEDSDEEDDFEEQEDADENAVFVTCKLPTGSGDGDGDGDGDVDEDDLLDLEQEEDDELDEELLEQEEEADGGFGAGLDGADSDADSEADSASDSEADPASGSESDPASGSDGDSDDDDDNTVVSKLALKNSITAGDDYGMQMSATLSLTEKLKRIQLDKI